MPGLKELTRAEQIDRGGRVRPKQIKTHNLSLDKALDALKTQTVDGQRPRI